MLFHFIVLGRDLSIQAAFFTPLIAFLLHGINKNQCQTDNQRYFAAVNPLAWVGPDDSTTELQLGMPQLPPPSISDHVDRPAKRQARTAPSKDIYSIDPTVSTESR